MNMGFHKIIYYHHFRQFDDQIDHQEKTYFRVNLEISSSSLMKVVITCQHKLLLFVFSFYLFNLKMFYKYLVNLNSDKFLN
jgi:hypothetical protein